MREPTAHHRTTPIKTSVSEQRRAATTKRTAFAGFSSPKGWKEIKLKQTWNRFAASQNKKNEVESFTHMNNGKWEVGVRESEWEWRREQKSS